MPLGAGFLHWVLACRTIEKKKMSSLLGVLEKKFLFSSTVLENKAYQISPVTEKKGSLQKRNYLFVLHQSWFVTTRKLKEPTFQRNVSYKNIIKRLNLGQIYNAKLFRSLVVICIIIAHNV